MARDLRLLRDLTLLDGSGAAPRHGMAVLLLGDRVAEVTSAATPAPAAARVEALGGRVLMPGLFDVHAHARAPDLLRLLEHGVTTIRIPGGRFLRGQRGPTVVAAGRFIDGEASLLPDAARCHDETEVRQEVRRQAEQGMEWVKLYTALPPPLVRAAVDEAHARGLRVVGDLVATSWTEAARAGIDSLCHAAPRHPALLPERARDRYVEDLGRGAHPVCRFLELLELDAPEVDEMVDVLAGTGVAVDPTLVGLESLLFTGDPDYHRGLPPGDEKPPRLTPEAVEELRRRAIPAWEKALALVGRLHRGGVRIVAGTDCPRPFVAPGVSLWRELRLLARAGLSATEAVHAATGAAAVALGLGDERGVVRAGLRADLLLLDGDPLAEVTPLVWTMQGGTVR